MPPTKNRKRAAKGANIARSPKKIPVGRRRGRPSGVESALLDRDTILSVAFQLTKSVPLADISIIRVARELGVTPALIHYYMGGRDAVTSGIMNLFYRQLVEAWPKRVTPDWKHHLEVAADTVYRSYLRYPGIAAYVVSHNRFRMIQDTAEDEVDYGVQFFERFCAAVQSIGFDASLTGIYAHLLMEYIISSAHSTVRHMWPGEHRDFLDRKLSALDPVQFPATHFVREGLININASAAFTIGLGLLMQALEFNRENLGQREAEALSAARNRS